MLCLVWLDTAVVQVRSRFNRRRPFGPDDSSWGKGSEKVGVSCLPADAGFPGGNEAHAEQPRRRTLRRGDASCAHATGRGAQLDLLTGAQESNTARSTLDEWGARRSARAAGLASSNARLMPARRRPLRARRPQTSVEEAEEGPSDDEREAEQGGRWSRWHRCRTFVAVPRVGAKAGWRPIMTRGTSKEDK